MVSIKIRKAVGAIVIKKDKFLLIHKVKMMNSLKGPEKIKPRWDFPKGGVKNKDINLENAILRELKEETGSDEYRIIKKFDEKIIFEFPDKIKQKLGFEKQEITMFLIKFYGDENKLKSQDDEIDNIKLFSKIEVEKQITFEDSKSFFIRNI
ncbi:MAG: NUDIX domain-containing protein [Promethearchaeota archaeon]